MVGIDGKEERFQSLLPRGEYEDVRINVKMNKLAAVSATTVSRLSE